MWVMASHMQEEKETKKRKLFQREKEGVKVGAVTTLEFYYSCASVINILVFQISILFVPWCQEGPFLGVMFQDGVTMHGLKTACVQVQQATGMELTGALQVRLEGVFLEVYFPVNKISRLQTVVFGVFITLECTMKRLLYKSMVILNRSN